jgi:hypothetical protein
MLGYESKGELLRANLAKDMCLDPGEHDKAIELYSNTHLAQVREALWKTKDGRRIKVRVSGRNILDSGSKERVFEQIVEGTTALQ